MNELLAPKEMPAQSCVSWCMEDVGDRSCSGNVIFPSGARKRRSFTYFYTITQFLRIQLLLQRGLNDHCSEDDLIPVSP